MSVTTVLRQSASTSKRLLRPAPTAIASFCSSSNASSSNAPTPPPSVPKAKKPKVARALSSCLPGTILTGLSILKDKPDPVSLPDEQYPAWLWTLLEDTSKAHKAAEGVVKLSKEGSKEFDAIKEKRKLKNLSREKIKASNYLKSTT